MYSLCVGLYIGVFLLFFPIRYCQKCWKLYQWVFLIIALFSRCVTRLLFQTFVQLKQIIQCDCVKYALKLVVVLIQWHSPLNDNICYALGQKSNVWWEPIWILSLLFVTTFHVGINWRFLVMCIVRVSINLSLFTVLSLALWTLYHLFFFCFAILLVSVCQLAAIPDEMRLIFFFCWDNLPGAAAPVPEDPQKHVRYSLYFVFI